MTLDPATMPVSLAQIKTKQSEFLVALERRVKQEDNTNVDIFAVAKEVDIVPELAIEFLTYWISMGRLHRDWTEVAARKREELSDSPLRPPKSMIVGQPKQGRPRKVADQNQQHIYADLWQDMLGILETRNASQWPYENREEGRQFHSSQYDVGISGIRKVDRLAPYLSEGHYDIIRGYFNTFCNYHLHRERRYEDQTLAKPSDWDEESKQLYGQLFGRGLIEVKQAFQEVMAGQGVADAFNLNNVGSFHMGDRYTANTVGVMGPNATGNTVNLQQIWNQLQGSLNVEELAKELGTLQTAMTSEAKEPDQHLATGAVAAAEAAAKGGDGPKALEYLQRAGGWALDVATKIGVDAVSSALKGPLGLGG